MLAKTILFMKRNLPPLDITNIPELARFVEEMKTPKQQRALIKDGEAVELYEA